MFEKLIALFERFVVAHERLAASQEAMLKGCMCASTDLVDEIKEAVSAPPVATTAATVTKEEAPNTVLADSWNPFVSELQGRYGADKIAIMDSLLAEKGIEMKAKATGAEKHQALLAWDAEVKASLAPKGEPAAPAPAPETLVPAPEEYAPAVTIDDIRALAQKCMAAKIAPARVQDLLEQHGGSRRLPEVAEDKFGAVYAALKKELGE